MHLVVYLVAASFKKKKQIYLAHLWDNSFLCNNTNYNLNNHL